MSTHPPACQDPSNSTQILSSGLKSYQRTRAWVAEQSGVNRSLERASMSPPKIQEVADDQASVDHSSSSIRVIRPLRIDRFLAYLRKLPTFAHHPPQVRRLPLRWSELLPTFASRHFLAFSVPYYPYPVEPRFMPSSPTIEWYEKDLKAEQELYSVLRAESRIKSFLHGIPIVTMNWPIRPSRYPPPCLSASYSEGIQATTVSLFRN
ncbi:hypothetical protein BT69DRAFT_1329034 [Atractiella rhizophila]|nr:hypothetical protein BT69DRAFT_1329034 [Atractiella rhizophila]